MAKTIEIIILLSAAFVATTAVKKIHYVHWNKNNPMFRIDNTDHIVDVNRGNLPWEYDQVNIICPTSKAGTRFPEQHVIYSVSREEFDSCRITNPKPRIVAICNRPFTTMYFTITFRSFTPTPGGLEFKPGNDYFFISTASREDLHRRVGGGCATHNMKMVFRVADNRPKINPEVIANSVIRETTTTTTTTSKPSLFYPRYNSKVPSSRGNGYLYYYHPRDLIEVEDNEIDDRRNKRRENDVWGKSALRYTSSSVNVSGNHLIMFSLTFATMVWKLCWCCI